MRLGRDPAGPLWAWTGPRLFLGGLILLSVACCLAPLADHLGYELSELIALYFGLFGGSIGVASARRERLRQREGRMASAGAAVVASLGFAVAALAVPVVILLFNAVRRPSCDPLGGLVLYGAIALPSAVLAAVLGTLCGFVGGRIAGWIYALLFSITLAVALWPIAFGPQVFAFHHLGGMFPGPIYDEAIRATPALWYFRCGTLLWTFTAAALAILAGPQAALSSRGDRRRSGGALALAVFFGAASVVLSLQAGKLHFRASLPLLDRELGGLIETPHLVLHVPREKPEAERKLLAAQAELAVAEVRTFLGLPKEPRAGAPRIDVFLYRSAAEKRTLIGAADTSFAKPWLHQIHTNDAPAPHRILRHELVHAIAAEVAHGPFKVPGRFGGLLPEMTLIEGLAVAADWPAGEFTVHEEAAALRALGLAPEVAKLLEPGSFHAESGPRAYTMAGSFVRWLWFTRGPALLNRIYAGEPIEQVYGPLPALAEGHAKYLEGRGAPARVQALLGQRFRAPGIVRRRCPHEVADLTRQANEALAGTDAARAVELWRKCAALEPDDPNLLLGLRRAQLAAKDPTGAREAEEAALAHPKLGPAQRAQLLIEAGDAAWKAGDAATAKGRYEEAAKLPQFEPQERAVEARLAALAEPESWPAAKKLLADNDPGPLTWLLLSRWSESRPLDGLPLYLLAKQMQNRRDFEECGKAAALALQRRLPGPLFVIEAHRMRGIAAWHLGDRETARAEFAELKKGATTAGRVREADDWLGLVP